MNFYYIVKRVRNVQEKSDVTGITKYSVLVEFMQFMSVTNNEVHWKKQHTFYIWNVWKIYTIKINCVIHFFRYFRSWKYQYQLWFLKFTVISVWTRKKKPKLSVSNVTTALIKLKKKNNLRLCKTVLEAKGSVSREILCRESRNQLSFQQSLGHTRWLKVWWLTLSWRRSLSGGSCRKLRIWSHLLEKSLMENFIFCAVLFLGMSWSVPTKLKATH